MSEGLLASISKLAVMKHQVAAGQIVPATSARLMNGQEIELVPGTVVLEAFFRGGTELGTQYKVQLAAGEVVTIRCRADFQRCTCVPRNACAIQ